jgi:hypothetical protein
MALKNYTTDVPVNKTISEIHLMLADHGAKKIMFNYFSDGRVESVCFTLMTPSGERGVKLPANAERVREVLKKQKQDQKNRNRSSIDDSKEQAERVAWRIVKDWLAAQLAIIETEMVEIEQVFFPYLIDRSGKTLYEFYQSGQLLLPE